MADFEIINSSFDLDSSDYLEHVYAAEDIENDANKTESQQTYQEAIETYMFQPRAADSDNMSSEAVQDKPSQNADHLVDNLLW